MDFFKGIGDFFRGAFGGQSEEEKRRKRQQQQQAQQQRQQQQARQAQQKPQQQIQVQRPQQQVTMLMDKKPQGINQLFGKKNQDNQQLLAQVQPIQKPQLKIDQDKKSVVAPQVQPKQQATAAPQPNPQPQVDANALRQKAAQYQKPAVQDVNNYYGRDLKALNDELAKGDKANMAQVQGLMKSLDNRRTELQAFHKARSESSTFKGARELEQNIKNTRGDWTKQKNQLKQFWDTVGKNQTTDFTNFLKERGVIAPDKTSAAQLFNQQSATQLKGGWKYGGQYTNNFEEEKQKIAGIKQRQDIADLAMSNEYKDIPLEKLGGQSFSQFLSAYNAQDAGTQRETMKKLEKTLKDNEIDFARNPDLKQKQSQTMMLYQLLSDRGQKKEDFGTKAQDFGDGVGGFVGGMADSMGRLGQSADTLRREVFNKGRSVADELTDDYKAGKMSPEDYNRRMNDYKRSLDWAGDGKGGVGESALKALGTSADVVSTILPFGGVVKGAKGAMTARNLMSKAMASGMTKDAAESFAREEMKALVKDGTRDSMKKTIAKEAGQNAAWSGVGATRDGEVDSGQILSESALGGVIGGAAPLAGSGATKLWSKIRGADKTLPDAIEDVGRFANKTEATAAESATKDGVEAELRSIVDDPNAPPFQRNRAQEILDTQKREPESKVPEVPKDGIDRPSYLVKREIQDIYAQEENHLNDYLNENQDLTPAQVQAARDAATERAQKLVDELRANRVDTETQVDELANENAKASEERVNTVEEVKANQAEAVAPQKGEAIPEAPKAAGAEVQANNAYADNPETRTQTQVSSDGYIRRSDMSSGDARRSPQVSPQQFDEHVKIGKMKLDSLDEGSAPTVALDEPQSWNQIVNDTYGMTREQWGGATIDAHTGQHVPVDADAYALTVKDPGMKSVSVSPTASPQEFAQAMNEAKQKFAHILARKNSHLGVFHDADTGMIDIDPVLITNNLQDVHDIGAYTRSTGGAYHFASGDGFWAPHIADDAVPRPEGDAIPGAPADPSVLTRTTADDTDDILKLAGIDTTQGQTQGSNWKKWFHNASNLGADHWWKGNVDKVRDAASRAIYDAIEGGNIFTQAPQRIATLFSQNVGLRDGLRQIVRIRNDMQSAAGDAVKRLHNKLSDDIANLDMDTQQFNQTLDQVFESPEFLARKYGENVPNISVDQLPSDVRGIVDTLIEANKMRNRQLFKQGRISLEEYKMFENGMHSPRLYDFEKEGMGQKGNKLIDTTSTKKRRNLDEISDETFDKLIESPAQRMLIRLEMAMRSGASNDALDGFSKAGMVYDRAPNNQFSKLEGAKWGNYQGKYIYNPIRGQLEDAIIMNTETGQKFNDLLDMYRDSPFGKIDRFAKKTKTVYSPGTFMGNLFSNPLVFNTGAGLNPLGQMTRMGQAGADLVAHRTGRKFNADIYEAQKHGVFASDTGKQITGRDNPELTVTKSGKSKLREIPENVYGGADDAAKLAVWRGLRRRGVEPEEAARRVAQFTQDYNNAGRLVQTLADMPVLGKPFARFAPELVRLVKNNMMYNPVGMAAGVAGIAYIQKQLSDMSGETPEEREARETGMGQTLIPGTAWINKALTGTDRDISLNFPLGGSAVNIARAVGLNFPIDESGDPNTSLIKSLAPWAIPTRENAQGETVLAPEELFTSLAWSPIAQQIANRDFMNRTIDDPKNKVYYENGKTVVKKYAGDNPNAAQDRMNHLIQSYVPLASEAGSMIAALGGQEDYYGKKRTVPEAIGRMFGIKIEGNGADVRQKRIDTKNYFEEDLASVQKFVRENPDLADKYFQLKNPTRTRPTEEDPNGTKVSDLVSPEKWDIINSDTSGRLFNFLKDQAIKQSQNEKNLKGMPKPLDPIYTLPPDQAKYVAELRSRPTGDDEEAKDILRATSNWYKDHEKKYFEYLTNNTEFFKNIEKNGQSAKENPRVKEYTDASAPVEQPPIIAEYLRIKAADPAKAKQVYKANKDALSAAFDKYAEDKLNRINTLRKIEGYEPLSLEVYKNKTFGFNLNDGGGFSSGYGGGYGRRRGGYGGGSGENDVNTLGELTNFSNNIKGYNPVEAEAMPNIAQMFETLQATKGGSHSKPKIGASSRGQ